MIVARHAPTLGDRQIGIGPAVLVDVAQASEFRPLDYIEIAVVVNKAERFVKPAGKPLVRDVGGRIVIHVAGDPNITFAKRGRDTTVGQERQPAYLEFEAGRDGQRDHLVVVVFRLSRGDSRRQ